MTDVDVLKSKLLKIKDYYTDFEYVADDVDRYKGVDKVVNYIDEHPNATTSDIIEFITDNIFKIPKWNEKTQQYEVKQ